MTSYVETASVAHLMEFLGPGRYRSACYRGPKIDARVEEEFARMRYVGYDARTKPWCRYCQAVVRRLYDDVIEPSPQDRKAGQ